MAKQGQKPRDIPLPEWEWSSRGEFEQAEEKVLSDLAKIDPWSATLEEVNAATITALQSPIARFSSRVHNASDQLCRRYVHALNVKDARPAVEAGKGMAVMFAVNECLQAGLVAPPWLADAFGKRYQAVGNLEVNSWDDEKAFGRPFPGAHLDAAKEAREAALPVRRAVDKLRAEGMPTGGALWEAAAEALGRDASAASWVRDVYYATQKAGAFIDARLGIPPEKTRGRPKKSKT